MSMFEGLFIGFRRRAVRKEVAKLRALTVGDIMTTYVITVKPGEKVEANRHGLETP